MWGGVLGILGIIFSAIGQKKSKNGLSIAGLIASIIGLVLFVVIMFAIFLFGMANWTIFSIFTAMMATIAE